MHMTQSLFSNVQDGDSDTPLVEAYRRGHVEIARVLVEHRANVDQQSNVSSRISKIQGMSRHNSRAYFGWRLWPHQSFWNLLIHTSKEILY